MTLVFRLRDPSISQYRPVNDRHNNQTWLSTPQKKAMAYFGALLLVALCIIFMIRFNKHQEEDQVIYKLKHPIQVN